MTKIKSINPNQLYDNLYVLDEKRMILQKRRLTK